MVSDFRETLLVQICRGGVQTGPYLQKYGFVHFNVKYMYLPSLINFPPNLITAWKFHDFPITQIFRQLNFGDFRGANSAIVTLLETLNFDFYYFLHFLKAEIYQINKIPTSI